MGPTIALEQHRGARHAEVDLPALDDRMEDDRWESVLLHQPVHDRLQQRIRGLLIDRPDVDRLPESHGTGSPVTAVFPGHHLQSAQADEARCDGMSDGIDQAVRVDRAEIGERAKCIGASNAVSARRDEPIPISRTMHHHSVEVPDATRTIHDQVDRFMLWTRESPQAGSRPMTGEGSGYGEHRCRNPLLGSGRGARHSRDTGVDLLQGPRADRPVPGGF